MKATISSRGDYPVFIVERPTAQLLPVDPINPAGTDIDGTSVSIEIDIDESVVERFEKARAEWVTVQTLLTREYGDAVVAAAPLGGTRQRGNRRDTAPEWVANDAAKNWGVRKRSE